MNRKISFMRFIFIIAVTAETAVAKLYYLFSCGYDVQTVKTKMEEDIAGEITRI